MSFNPFYNIENPELMGYEYAWVDFIKNGTITENIIKEEIFDSWNRCKNNNLDAMTRIIPNDFCGYQMLETKINKNAELLEIGRQIIESFVNVLSEKNCRMVIADSDKYILMDIQKNDKFKSSNKSLLGENCSEEYMGTNSLDLAIKHKKPISVIGAEHYFQQNHKYAEYAAPIFGPDNNIKGVIGIVIKLEEMGNYILALLAVAAKAIENELRLYENNNIIFQQNKEKENILNLVTDGIVYLDSRHIITQANYQIANFIGIEKEGLIGKPIDLIQTIPSLLSIINDETQIQNNVQLKLKGKSRSYNCFLNHNIVKNSQTTDSYMVLIFTTTEEIQVLADKMNYVNRAFFTFDNVIGESRILAEAIELAKKAADHETKVIIEGESGTGKELFAQAIHNRSARHANPFVAIDCGAIPRELLESEIFGYEEGAFTGARKGGHRGKLELAHRGTLFLDEIGNLPLEMQVKLLRVLQESKVVRVGGSYPISFDVQIIAATNQDLKSEVASGTFRGDLLYRLDIVHIKLPPLRERKEDIPTMIDHFIYTNRNQINREVKGIDDEAKAILVNYNWPGNVRQLNNVIERMMILSDGGKLTKEQIPSDITSDVNNMIFTSLDLDNIDTLEAINYKYVKNVVEIYKGNIKKASEVLGISRATIYRFLKNHHEEIR